MRTVDNSPVVHESTPLGSLAGMSDAAAALEKDLTRAGSLYELVDSTVDGIRCRVYRHGPQSLNDIFRRALAMGDAALAVFEQRRLSYREAFSEAARLAALLRHRYAIGDGKRVAIALPNSAEWIVTFIAVTSLGAAAALIDPADSDRLQHAISISGCSLLIVEPSALSAAKCVSGAASVLVTGRSPLQSDIDAKVSYQDDLMTDSTYAAPAPMSLRSLSADSEAVIAFTSGTSSRPKGVVLTHVGVITGLMNMMLGGLLANAAAPQTRQPNAAIPSAPCVMVLSPLPYIGGYAQMLLMLMVGGRVVIPCGRDLEDICRLIDVERVRSVSGVSLSQMTDLIRIKPDSGPLAYLAINGTALHTAILDDIAARWSRVVIGSGYGMTETNGSIAMTAGRMLRTHPSRSGRVLPTVEVRIVGENGLDLADGEVGEIWLRGASLMRGYCGSSRCPEGLIDGWFKTGDLGRLSTDRYLSLLDRISNTFMLGHKTTSSLEIERVVVQEEGVAEAAAWCVKGEGEIPLVKIMFVPHPGEVIEINSLRARVASALAISETRVEVFAAATLPRNQSGKVDRALLRERRDSRREVASFTPGDI
jgi:long-chain acyl-CoA synthetase